MRRIETGMTVAPGKCFPARWISERDYRLLLAVARAADTWERSGRWVDSVAVAEAVDRLNAKPKGKRT
jgi:hypothetical protein